ncbi:MAG TPA: response regulator transcription factor [Ferruginibacter sp.]|nr:response regulator transcription factor [Ferruginibacter sp.]HMP21422.1 response regulator transcription factor [Ferruginibacter sp.]
MPIKVFIADDHYMIIEGIRSLLQHEKDIEWLGHAGNADSCLAFLQQQQPDVLLMDISMPGMSGIELCSIVKNRYPQVFVLGLSTFNQQSFIQKMMENGASGYVLKNATQQELLEAIITVSKGKTYISDEAAAALLQAEKQSQPLITRREKEVLSLIAEGLTNGEIAAKLFISIATVDTHRKNLLVKFQTKNTASLVKTAMQLQLI